MSHMAMQWGQFIDHDMVATAKAAFDCCHQEIRYLVREDRLLETSNTF